MRRLRCSSVAMRRYMSMSSVLWWVMKGRAVAPPEMVLSTGVSTSMKPARVQEAADVADELAADLEVAAALVAHDEVHVALAVLELDVGHAVELLRQGAQALGEQRHALDMDADLAGLGLEHIARDADDVADVVLAEVRELLLADGVGADVELNLALVVLDVAEDGLAHAALGHDAARGLDGLALKGLVVVALSRWTTRCGQSGSA